MSVMTDSASATNRCSFLTYPSHRKLARDRFSSIAGFYLTSSTKKHRLEGLGIAQHLVLLHRKGPNMSGSVKTTSPKVAKNQGPSKKEIIDFLKHGPSKPDTHCLTTKDWQEVLEMIIHDFERNLKVMTRFREVDELANDKTYRGGSMERVTNKSLMTKPQEVGLSASCLMVHEWEMGVERCAENKDKAQFINYGTLLITKTRIWLWWQARYVISENNEKDSKWILTATKSDFVILDGKNLIESIHQKICHLAHHDTPWHAAHDLAFGIANLIGNSRMDKQNDIWELDRLARNLTEVSDDRAGMSLRDFANQKRQY